MHNRYKGQHIVVHEQSKIDLTCYGFTPRHTLNSQVTSIMALESALNCNTTTNFTSNYSSPQGPMVNPYLIKIEPLTAIRCNLTANFTGNSSSCPQHATLPSPMIDPAYLEFYKFVLGSAIYIIIISFTTFVANGLLLVVFLLQSFENIQEPHNLFPGRSGIRRYLNSRDTRTHVRYMLLMIYLGHPDTDAICSPLFEAGHLLSVMGVPTDIHQKCDIILHSIIVIYLTILFYILLYKAFKKKMAASENLREDNNMQNGGKDNRQMAVQRKFIIINFLLITILFVSSQPSTILWFIHLYSNDDPYSPKVQIRFLMAENVLYLKFLLDPFVYAWRIPKYRQALKIVLRCGREEPETKSTFSDRVMARMSASRDTVITLNFKNITPD
ncbi:hypothetical protein OS493_032084 [Desmophyllum pertusum]|uniref:G-protein coupled receptors family 1 profile domain-containing protein n=1 Tax=Desmophyllum pertusum TaxID=174260 RepID=A0A9W9YJB7_9CNID|nr:hypothetical protein OS493_032084 [Desmophyllum pertusum]